MWWDKKWIVDRWFYPSIISPMDSELVEAVAPPTGAKEWLEISNQWRMGIKLNCEVTKNDVKVKKKNKKKEDRQ